MISKRLSVKKPVFNIEKTGKLPDALVACVGGGSNAIGLFFDFLNDTDVKMYGVEATGDSIETGRHSAPLAAGRIGVLHGNRTYLMADDEGQIKRRTLSQRA